MLRIRALAPFEFVGLRRFKRGEAGDVPAERAKEVRALAARGVLEILSDGSPPVVAPTPPADLQTDEEAEEIARLEAELAALEASTAAEVPPAPPPPPARPVANCKHCGKTYLEHPKRGQNQCLRRDFERE